MHHKSEIELRFRGNLVIFSAVPDYTKYAAHLAIKLGNYRTGLCIGYNTVWSALCECNTPDSVVTYLFHDTHQMATDTQAYYRANF